ncbi:bacterial regulatory helix-turn-helix, lysR family protein [Paraburkholderia xenovorans LB400]|jgi:DNA-binding transcriptional LysR family regulator|uniref:Transcriptional regulator, LysR family n=1 Tax=Paraburkholderia xenovorans (strain LB400) TaxID=266265 RepID=Q13R43_PARXL|nr:LysR substrate-binding domain-containing protein [Paraburkholderia xenovorans]ABE33446.1 transcriptional regulator, LysR family [Paraburkholderia xenovorans LB400]AIP36869.1 bacterial regulatory helix-turn-helix, lysR family protein [Paraburkholderia xenovorans LB400]NPT36435.1 LysR family transcriptional regulator [Paraburkholderia xenovorans]
MLKVRHLEIFRAVVKAGSVSAAARLLYVSQPAVTKTLRMLEEEIGLTLFLRVKGRLVCTPEAESILPEIERLFGSVQSIAETAREIRQGQRGSIRVSTVSMLATTIVARAVGEFRKTHPYVEFDVRALPTRHVVEYVNNNQADFGILDVAAPSGTLEVEEFCSADLRCVMRAAHPLASRKTITPRLLDNEALATFGEDTLTGWRLREAFRAQGRPFTSVFVSNSTPVLCALVREADAVALVDPFALMSRSFPDLVSRRFSPSVPVQPRFLFAPGRPRSVIVDQFVSQLRKTAGEMAMG